MPRLFRHVLGIALCLLGVSTLADQDVASPQDAGVPQAAADGSDVEDVIVVVGERGAAEAPVLMNEVTSANGKGGWLYRNRRYKEAFPYLLTAAEHGFKLAQARVSYIYQQGLGDVPRNADAAIGWLGVAASPTTTPEVRNYYLRVLDQFPQEYRGRIDEIVAEYRQKYGASATRVDCENDRLAGTHISRLKCDFRDAPIYRDALESDEIPQFVPPIESGP